MSDIIKKKKKQNSNIYPSLCHIDCIIYLIRGQERLFYSLEKDLLKEFIKNDEMDIIIICNNTFEKEKNSI